MLERLERLERPIRIGITGCGSMGRGLLYQAGVTPGIDCVAVADIDLETATRFAGRLGRASQVVEDDASMVDAIAGGRLAICADGNVVARCAAVDVLVESTNAILPAARFALTAIDHGKHLVLMNSEIDLIFGPELMRMADARGVVYTSCDGDQHGVIKRVIDEFRLWGFAPVMAGNIKGFLDRYSNPEKIIPEADKRNLSYRMAAAYTDGTKLCVEMALLANALGYAATEPGMHGPRAADVHEVFSLFDFEAIHRGGVPAVDYILGAEPNGGVFAVGFCEDRYQADMLAYYKMGPGPYYLFYRPYHLCHVEAMQGIAEAVLDGRSLLRPDHGLRTNVYARAKENLRAGTRLDGIGGFTCYGVIENDADRTNPGLPICLADDVTLLRDVPRDGRIDVADVRVDGRREDFELWQRARSVAPRTP